MRCVAGWGKATLVDGLIGASVGVNATLERITALLDWPALAAVLVEVYAAPTGRPSFPVGLLPRALLLLQALRPVRPGRRGGARRSAELPALLGVGLDEPTPDHSTLWRFREALAHRELAQAPFAAAAP